MQSLTEKIIIEALKSESLNESQFNNWISSLNKSDFVKKLKNKLGKLKDAIGEKIVKDILKIYYVATDNNTPVKDKLDALSCVIKLIYPDSNIDKYHKTDFENEEEMVDYSLNFLQKHITDDIAEKADKKYKEIFK